MTSLNLEEYFLKLLTLELMKLNNKKNLRSGKNIVGTRILKLNTRNLIWISMIEVC